MAAAANIWVKSLASWQIGVKTESKSNDARLVTVTLVTRYITRQIENTVMPELNVHPFWLWVFRMRTK